MDENTKAVMFSSESSEWTTPEDIFELLNEEFRFAIDVAATKENALCKKFLTKKKKDALSVSWYAGGGAAWMNPPYGRGIGRWVARARTQAAKHNMTVVCLIPARTDTKWFADHCVHGEVRFIKGRLKFGKVNKDGEKSTKDAAPFPSMVVIFGPDAWAGHMRLWAP